VWSLYLSPFYIEFVENLVQHSQGDEVDDDEGKNEKEVLADEEQAAANFKVKNINSKLENKDCMVMLCVPGQDTLSGDGGCDIKNNQEKGSFE